MIRIDTRAAVKRAFFGAALALSLCAASCQPSDAPAAAEAVDPALTQYVLADVPSDVPNRCYLDFGGKLALVGYAIEPTGVAAPGSKVKLTLYWQSLSQLGPGWGLFTHLLIPHQPHRLLDSSGPLRKLVSGADGGQRQALGPSAWEPGKIYVDPLEFQMPTNVHAAEVTVVAGVWRDALRVIKEGETEDPKLALPGLRLPVLSGPADDMQRGVILHIRTGLPEQLPPLTTAPRRAPNGVVSRTRGKNDAHGAH